MSCGLNLNLKTVALNFFFLTYTRKGGERKIKEGKNEIGQDGEEARAETRENKLFLSFG